MDPVKIHMMTTNLACVAYSTDVAYVLVSLAGVWSISKISVRPGSILHLLTDYSSSISTRSACRQEFERKDLAVMEQVYEIANGC